MPARNQRHLAIFIALLTVQLGPTRVSATAMEDSLHATVSGFVSAQQRAQALLTLAKRTLTQDPVVAHGHAANALAFAESAGDARMEHLALMSIAESEERLGLIADYMKTVLRALPLAQSLGDPVLIAEDLRALSHAYRLNGMPDKAVEEARNALAMVLPTQTGTSVDEAHRFLLETLLHAGQYDEVLQMAERCLNNARRNGNSMEEARLGQLVGETLLAQGKHLDAYTYLVRAERTLARHGSATERFSILGDLAQVLLSLARHQEASTVLDRTGHLLQDADTWNNRLRYTELRYHLARAQGRWEEALALLQLIKERTDSMNHARLDAQMARMQMSFQLERKEKANAALRSENALNVERIEAGKLNNRLLLALLAGISALAVALFFTSRHSLRMMRRMALKNAVIKKQHDEIHAKNLELQRQNMRLAETLVSEEEKEMMIKEIHHRVKNNLQVVDSLLQIQSADCDDPTVDRVLKEAQGRIRSMAMVHEHIYRSAGGSRSDLQVHLEHLVRNILVAHGAHDRISVSVTAPMPAFSTETLMPLTLIVNELFTNAVKYAFGDRNSGRITIVVRPSGAAFEMLFSDDGIGLGTDEAALRDRSFGMELVRMLAHQLNGEVRFLKGQGTTVALTFAPDRQVLRRAS